MLAALAEAGGVDGVDMEATEEARGFLEGELGKQLWRP